jgi:16S rRNA (cytidine1402-2'-O)-methyltransferase
LAEGLGVIPIPGPSALLAALTASGLPTDRFAFENFPPKKSGQRRHKLEALHAKWSESEAHAPTLCFFATPYNLAAFLQEISEVFGPDLHVVLAREISKKFEEFQRGPVSLWAEHYSKHTPRGEFVLMFHPQNKR